MVSSSLGFLLFCLDSISIRKTSECVTRADIGCGERVPLRESASARCRLSVFASVCNFFIISVSGSVYL